MSDADDGTRKPLGGDEPSPTASFDGQQKGPGGRIGPFRIERELGRGAVGVVYLAHDTKLDRSVAIKSLPAEVMANPKARSRFACEAGMMYGTVENQVPEWRATGAVCKNSRKRWLLDISIQLFWRFLRDNSLGRPENCCNLNEILILWGFKCTGEFL